MVGYMLVPFTQMLRDRGVQTLQQVNAGLAKTSSLGKAKRHAQASYRAGEEQGRPAEPL